MKDDFEDKPKGRYEPTKKEMDDLERELKKFPQKEINGKLVCPFDQYLAFLGVIRFGDHMQIWCKDIAGHERFAKINAKLELRQFYEQENLFQQYPEERKALANKFLTMRKGVKVKAACSECNCLLERTYLCRHRCQKCLASNPVTV